jgi:hypothetical protein
MPANLFSIRSNETHYYAGLELMFSGRRHDCGRPLAARRNQMRNALLFSVVAAFGFLVTLEIPAHPEAGFQADFEPAAPAATLQFSRLSLPSPVAPTLTL